MELPMDLTTTASDPTLNVRDLPKIIKNRARPRLLIFIVAYNAESTINSVLARIPSSLGDAYEVEVLIIDDGSTDKTFERVRAGLQETSPPFPLTLLFNPKNQGYGGNQKIGYLYAIKKGFDFVALVHGDGQYAPECLPELVRPLAAGQADAVFGSRMMTPGAALAGGMPRYKFIGNKILTWMQNRILNLSLSEFHSGYRIYAIGALKQVPFDRNTNDFHFDTEIIIQFHLAGLRIAEQPIPTYYGDEICHVNGIKYAVDVLRAVVKARCQKLGLLYDPRFDCAAGQQGNQQYAAKLGYRSTHSITAEMIPAGAKVADLGCAGGYMGVALKERKQCDVVGADMFPLGAGIQLNEFHLQNLNEGLPNLPWEIFDYVLLLDVIEHLADPEAFVTALRSRLRHNPDVKLLVSTANIGFLIPRLMLLFGKFNYGTKGILDRTHTRLFTFSTFCHLFRQNGFEVLEVKGVPAPLPLVFGEGRLSRYLMAVNQALITLRRGVFAYQIYLVVKPLPSIEYLLAQAEAQSAIRAAA
jgi:glycosyltransferase involved in cell wall biosynthesis